MKIKALGANSDPSLSSALVFLGAVVDRGARVYRTQAIGQDFNASPPLPKHKAGIHSFDLGERGTGFLLKIGHTGVFSTELLV